METPPDWSLATDLPLLLPGPPVLANYLVSEDELTDGEVRYDIASVTLQENVMSLLVEFLEQFPNWMQRELRFTSSRTNIPLVDEANIIIYLPDGDLAELTGIPLYQHQVKANSEELWAVFKAVMKGENTPMSWRRTLTDFEGLSEKATYHVRRLETPEVKRQAVTDFIHEYEAAGIKQVPSKLDSRGYHAWFMLVSRKEDKAVKLCVIIDNDNEQQNKAQFFELVKLYSGK
jgi:hypothetical protein